MRQTVLDAEVFVFLLHTCGVTLGAVQPGSQLRSLLLRGRAQRLHNTH